MAEKDELLDGVSPETDELASTLVGDALDLLAIMGLCIALSYYLGKAFQRRAVRQTIQKEDHL